MKREYTTGIRIWYLIIAVVVLSGAILELIEHHRVQWLSPIVGIALASHIVITRGMAVLTVGDGLMTVNTHRFARRPRHIISLNEVQRVEQRWSGAVVTLEDGSKKHIDLTRLTASDEQDVRAWLSQLPEINKKS